MLLIFNNIGTERLQQIIADNASLVPCSTIAYNGLYFLSQEEFDNIRNDSDDQVSSDHLYPSVADPHFVSAVNNYHTVKFATLKDLVYYWHRIFVIAIRKNFLILSNLEFLKIYPGN